MQSPAPRHLTLLGFTLGKSTLRDVEAKLGYSQVVTCSREEEASKEICYISRDGQTRVVFAAGFSGGWKELDGFKIISGVLKPSCYRRCTSTALVGNDIGTGGGLHLGMTRQDVVALLGSPTHSTVNRLIFRWHTRQPLKKARGEPSSMKDDYWDVQDSIEVIFVKSRVGEIEVQHLVTD